MEWQLHQLGPPAFCAGRDACPQTPMRPDDARTAVTAETVRRAVNGTNIHIAT